MSATSLVSSRLSVGVVSELLIVGRPSEATPAGTVTGQGSLGPWTVTADLRLRSDGTPSGRLQIVGRLQDATTPLTVASIEWCIFIDSISISCWPARTSTPAWTSMTTIVPCSGEVMVTSSLMSRT